MSASKKKAEKALNPSYLKTMPKLSYKELCQAILGEDSLSLYSFIPLYGPDRKIENESKKYTKID